MDEFRWFKIALLLFTAAGLDLASGEESSHIYIRDGDEATLPCKHVKNDQKNCDKIKWLFTDSGSKVAVNVIEGGQFVVNARERLNVSENCSLVIKKVSAEDGGQYSCRQQGHGDTHVHLFLITMSEQKNGEEITLFCSVKPCREHEHSLKWLSEDEDDEDNKHVETSSFKCSASVTFRSSDAQQKPKYLEAFKCEMDDLRTEQVHRFTFRPQSSGEKSDEEATTAATTEATTATRGTTESSNTMTTNSTRLTIKDWLLYAVVAACLLALIMIIVMIIVCKKTKGKKAEKDENTGQRLNPVISESAPQTSQDTADPEDGVSYASISYIKKDNKARVQVKYDDEDEGDRVTYSTVKVSSSSAGASDDPSSSLYDSVKKQAK